MTELEWSSSLPRHPAMQESFWWWQCSDRYIISLSPHFHTPSPLSLTLINLVVSQSRVSVDAKHHVYLWFWARVDLQSLPIVPQSCCIPGQLSVPLCTRVLVCWSYCVQWPWPWCPSPAVYQGHLLSRSYRVWVIETCYAQSLQCSSPFVSQAFSWAQWAHCVPVPLHTKCVVSKSYCVPDSTCTASPTGLGPNMIGWVPTCTRTIVRLCLRPIVYHYQAHCDKTHYREKKYLKCI